jgi:catechol 2,3-dioxygenase-like lactoylglutathione lyase family enzyme
MKLLFAAMAAVLLGLGDAAKEPVRPKILGIGSVRIQSSSVEGNATRFYIDYLGFGTGQVICAGASKTCLAVNSHQRIDLWVPEQGGTAGELAEITFETSGLAELRTYLIAHNVAVGEIVSTPGSNLHFEVKDPEGHQIGFIQYTVQDQSSHPENQVSKRLIHAGFIVHNREAMDRFYKDILGFHVSWRGGMKDNQTDWIDMQVPDGTDWIEYMLNVPANADKRTLGVMNHIALGVPDIHAAAKQLLTNGMKLTEEPKIGRDGKWQLNLYDPDQTRVELMEFTPVEKPCCADYTGPHPKP